MSERRIPEHLYPAFCLFVLAVQHGLTIRRGQGERAIAQAAQQISVVDTDAHIVAMEEAGGSLSSTGLLRWERRRRRFDETQPWS